MPDQENAKNASDGDAMATAATLPQVFISHDSRDTELAGAFSKLVKSVSGSMIKTFWSSDKKGTDGFDFGEDWYKGLLAKLQTTSDCVCLFTERSLDRPWILFEAGVAKAKLTTPVIGIAMGVPLSRVASGPFYQFQNLDDTEAELIKLMNQLARRVPNLEPDPDVVKTQVQAFKATEAQILKSAAASGGKKPVPDVADDSAVAKLIEEMKSLPSRVAERLSEDGDRLRGRRKRRMHPMMLDEVMHASGDSRDPLGVAIAASMIRDDVPWLYELMMDAYRAAMSGDNAAIDREAARLRRLANSKMMMHGPWLDYAEPETHYIIREFPRMVEMVLQRAKEERQPAAEPTPGPPNLKLERLRRLKQGTPPSEVP